MYLANRTPFRTLSEGRVPARCICGPALCRRGRRLLTRAEHRATAVGSESPELRPGETPEQALQRRLKESEEVEERVDYVGSLAEFQTALEEAGNRLVVLEVQSDNECQTGIPEAEVHWKHDAEAYKQMLMEQCRKVKHTFARTARECPDSLFYSVQADDEEVEELLDFCGVDLVPTVQFWRNSEKLWEHQGVPELEQDIGSGVMFYSMEGDEVCGMKTGTFVRDLHTRREVMDFIDSVPDNHLAVLDVSLPGASGCVRIWPAVIALAKNFQGHVEFARLLGNGTPEIAQVMRELNILEVPSFLFFKAGREVERHVGSSRGDLIGHILEVSARCGMAPPPPPPKQARPRRRGGRYSARRRAETVP